MSASNKPCARCKVAERSPAGSYCRPCASEYTREWRAKNPGCGKEYMRKWRAENPGHVKKRSNKPCACCKVAERGLKSSYCRPCAVARTRLWRAKNPGAREESDRKRCAENPDYYKESYRKRCAENPDYYKERRANNLDYMREYDRKWSERCRQRLADSYVRSALCRGANARLKPFVTGEIIQSKREHLAVMRLTKEVKRVIKDKAID